MVTSSVTTATNLASYHDTMLQVTMVTSSVTIATNLARVEKRKNQVVIKGVDEGLHRVVSVS